MLEKDQIQRLLDIAFMGCQNGQVGLARKVIDGLDQVLAHSPELEICKAMSFYVVDQFEPALAVLSDAGQAFPDNDMIKVHTALVHTLSGEKETARQTLSALAESSQEPGAAALAKSLLEEAC